MNRAEQFAAFQAIWQSAEYWEEGGLPYVYIPAFIFDVAGNQRTMDILLCPASRDNYPSRLFFAEKIAGRGDNWRTFTIRNSTWHAHSWKDVSASQPWVAILASHLKALK